MATRPRRGAAPIAAAAALVTLVAALGACHRPDMLRVERRLLFMGAYPRPLALTALEGDARPAPRGDEALPALHVPPPPGGRTLVWFHGNAQSVDDLGWLAQEARARGLGFFAPEYPGYEPAHAVEPSEDALFDAADRALRRLRFAPGGADRRAVVLGGQSLGTAVAVEMARRGLGARVLLVSPFTSIAGVLAPYATVDAARAALADRFDTAARAPRVRVPVLIVHGTADGLTPLWMGRALARAFPRARLLEVPRAGHNDIFDVGGAPLLEQIARFAAE